MTSTPSSTTRPPRRRRFALAVLVGALVAVLGASGLQPAGAAAGRKGPLTSNRLYQAKPLTGVGCTPASTVPLDSAANLKTYYASVLPCLDEAWKKRLKKAGIRFRAPKLVVHDGTARGSCYRGVFQLSYYCSGSNTIYMYANEIVDPWNAVPDDYRYGFIRLAGTHTLAHEYGHHVQNLAGILRAIGPRYRGVLERRAELQASCLANVFLSSQSDAFPIGPAYVAPHDQWRLITVADHGSVANQQLWNARGYSTPRAKSCNTFKARRASVS